MSDDYIKPKLKPCPFCGGADIRICHCEDDDGNESSMVWCVGCEATIEVDRVDDLEVLAKRWNTRSKETDNGS